MHILPVAVQPKILAVLHSLGLEFGAIMTKYLDMSSNLSQPILFIETSIHRLQYRLKGSSASPAPFSAIPALTPRSLPAQLVILPAVLVVKVAALNNSRARTVFKRVTCRV